MADSFQGLPKPDPERWPAEAGDEHWRMEQLAVPLEEVQANFARYGLLDEREIVRYARHPHLYQPGPDHLEVVASDDHRMPSKTLWSSNGLRPG